MRCTSIVGGRTDGADSPDHAAAMAGGYYAVDTTVVTFRIIRYRRWRSCANVYLLGWCVSAAGMLCFAAGGLKRRKGRWWRAAYCCFSARLCCATSSLVLADG